jgi:hypothetical protein
VAQGNIAWSDFFPLLNLVLVHVGIIVVVVLLFIVLI